MDCVVLADKPAASCSVDAGVSHTVFAEPNSATSARMLREPNSGMARSAAVYKRSDSSDVVGIVSHPLQGITVTDRFRNMCIVYFFGMR